MVPKTAGQNVPRFQIRVPFGVRCNLIRKAVLAAVHLDIISRLGTIEIQDIGPEMVLAAEFIPGKTAITQNAPELFLSVG